MSDVDDAPQVVNNQNQGQQIALPEPAPVIQNMASINLPNFPEFDLNPKETVAIRFNKYCKRMQNMFTAMDVANGDKKKAMFLHYVGEELCDVVDTLTIPAATDQIDAYDRTVAAITEYLEPTKCIDHHVYMFRKESQKSGETISEFHTRLQLLARKCEFATTDLEIKRQIIQGTTSARLRRKAIEQGLTLDNIIKTARAMEDADDQTNVMEKPHQANAIHRKPPYRPKSNNQGQKSANAFTKSYQDQGSEKKQKNTKCGLCGGVYPHKDKCPAQGKVCSNCGKQNHFSKVCRSNGKSKFSKYPNHQARVVELESATAEHEATQVRTEEEGYVFDVSLPPVSEKPYFMVEISGTPVKIMADSGATVNILNERDYLNLKVRPPLVESVTKVYPYMSPKPLNLCGKFQTEVTKDRQTCTETFHVTKGPSSSLLSWKASQRLNLIHVVNANTDTESLSGPIPEIVKEFQNIAIGMGACKGDPVKIHVDRSVKPVAQPHRRIPFHVRKQVEEKLMQLEEEDIIERAEGPTPWISPIVIVPKPHKPDEIRICVDMRAVNQAIIRERHVIPTVDDIISDLNGCKIFSKLDLNQGYHQILLHPESRHLTTFSTHIGLWRYKRLNFGMSCSAEIFQKQISDVITGIPGVRNISDDIYVGGADSEQHDNRLRAVLQRLQDNNLTINPVKCVFHVPSMLFFGHIFSESGISPDPAKVATLQAVPPPTNVTEVRSLLSSAAFCSRFIKDFAIITKPLRVLTHKDQDWIWGKEQANAFDQLKAALSTKTTLGYFNPEKPTLVYVDGSPIGLGAVLTQQDRRSKAITPLYFASYPLTATQARYPQIDREALSIYWAIKRFHLYLYGKEFTIITDHQPLVSLFNNPESKPSARIERWLMELQRYRFTLEYQPGPSNPADYASRHPISCPNPKDIDISEADQYVAYIMQNAIPKAMTLAEVESATARDPLLQSVMSSLKSQQWHQPSADVSLAELSRFELVKDELTCSDTVLLKSNRLVIPTALQERVTDLAHEGHLGISKTKALMREKVWFPHMDRLVESKIKACLACQISTPVPTKEPLQMTILPSGPFEEVSIDFAHVEGKTLLLVVDDYSRYPFVEIVSSTSASATIPKLDQIFAMFGTPGTVKSDNGPPFNGEDFARFAKILGFHHRKVTPLWPRANGEVERFVRTLKKSVKTAKAEGRNWQKEVQSFLRNYRTSPHSTTSTAPSTLFLKRAVRNKLPQSTSHDPIGDIIRKHDTVQKSKIKAHADNKNYVKPSNLKIGDTVLVKRPFTSLKSDTPYELTPMTISHRNGSMLTASDGNRTVTRNSSFFKRINDCNPGYTDSEGEDELTLAPDRFNIPDIESVERPPVDQPVAISQQTNPHSVPKSPVIKQDVPEPVRRSTRIIKAPERLVTVC